MSVWKTDPTFTNYVPQTAKEAVGRFVRCRTNGLSAMMIPECLIACSRGLDNDELDLFEQWIINPSGPVSLNAPLVETTALTQSNHAIYRDAGKRYESTQEADSDDEKLEALPLVPALRTATERLLAARAASATEAPAGTRTTSSAGPCRLGAASG